jgi:CDP-diacylglycerol--glycerol-3-phosphate 3-phosphatidyltransferase
MIIGALSDRMPPVLWVIAVLANLTVIHRMVFTWQEANKLEAEIRPAAQDTSGKAIRRAGISRETSAGT